MSTPATYDDVNLILRLYELRREEKMRAARDWFYAHFRPRSMAELQALCPPGSQENAYARMVGSYWEMVASFVTSGVLNQELFFQSGGEMLTCWERLKPLIPELRTMMKNPGIYRNLEAVGAEYAAYLKRQGPEAYEAFLAMIGPRPTEGSQD
jgi:hypothetical protein